MHDCLKGFFCLNMITFQICPSFKELRRNASYFPAMFYIYKQLCEVASAERVTCSESPSDMHD